MAGSGSFIKEEGHSLAVGFGSRGEVGFCLGDLGRVWLFGRRFGFSGYLVNVLTDAILIQRDVNAVRIDLDPYDA